MTAVFRGGEIQTTSAEMALAPAKLKTRGLGACFPPKKPQAGSVVSMSKDHTFNDFLSKLFFCVRL